MPESDSVPLRMASRAPAISSESAIIAKLGYAVRVVASWLGCILVVGDGSVADERRLVVW